jgi:hypothetical protein
MEERWSPGHYQVNKLFDHGHGWLTVHADAVLETGRNINSIFLLARQDSIRIPKRRRAAAV